MTELMMDLILGHFAGGAEIHGVCFGVEMIAEDRDATLPGSSLPGPVLTLRVDGPGRGLPQEGDHFGLGHADANRGLLFKDARGAGLAGNLLAGSGALGSARAGGQEEGSYGTN
jgi:hypothetical protein